MKNLNQIQNVNKKVEDIFKGGKDKYTYEDFDIKSYQYSNPDRIEVKVSKMYSFVEINSIILLKLSQLFETLNIDVTDRDSNPGCETCDYGSNYSYTLVIKPEKQTDEDKFADMADRINNYIQDY